MVSQTKLSQILILTVLYVAAAHARQQCGVKKDIVFIYELPFKSKSMSLVMAQITSLKTFMSGFHTNVLLNQCNQYKLLVVSDRQSSVVVPFKCDDQCLSLAENKLKAMANNFRNKRRSNQDTVSDTLGRLNDIFSIDEGGRFDADSVIVLMLTSPLQTSVIDAANMLPWSYDLFAIGIDEGAKTDIGQIVENKHHYLLVQDVRELLPGKAGFDVVQRLISHSSHDRFLPQNLLRADPGCRFIADVAFLVDASGSARTEYLAQLQFVQYIIASFGISKRGSHYGIVVFSDGGKHTSLELGLNEEFDLQTIVERIERLSYKGYRTRIDLGFKVANEQLFTKKGGERDGVDKMVFLLTDGIQNPVSDVFGNKYDPIAASQPLVDRGINIYAIGVGNETNKEELALIARSEDNVFFANSAIDLRNLVQTITRNICKKANVASPIVATTSTTTALTTQHQITSDSSIQQKQSTDSTSDSYNQQKQSTDSTKSTTDCTTPPSPCKNNGLCSKCCGGQNIYINIVNPGKGTTYLLQGVQLGNNPNNVLENITQNKPDVVFNNSLENQENLIERVKMFLPNNPQMIRVLRNALQYAKRRSRRSVTRNVHGRLSTMNIVSIAESLGCKLFLEYLQKANLLQTLINKSKHMPINIFCPKDDVFQSYMSENSKTQNVDNVVLGHVMTEVDHMRYKPFNLKEEEESNKRSCMVNSGLDSNLKLAHKIQDSVIEIVLKFGPNLTISIINSMIKEQHHEKSLMDLLKQSPNLSTMYQIFQKSPLKSVLQKASLSVNKICFTVDLCLPVQGQVQHYYHQLIEAKQFTFQVFDDATFSRMRGGASKLKLMKANKKLRDDFIRQHVFLGMLQHPGNNSNTGLIATSVQKNHPVSELLWSDGKPMISDSNGFVYIVDRVERVKEGLVQILTLLG